MVLNSPAPANNIFPTFISLLGDVITCNLADDVANTQPLADIAILVKEHLQM